MQFLLKHSFKFAVGALVVLMGIYLYLTYGGSSSDTPKLPVQQAAPDFTMADAISGDQVKFSDASDKVRLIYFYWANCPDVCPPTTQLMSEVQEQLKADGKFGTDVELFSVTFDPVRDTPDAIKKYAGKFDADFSGWKFLRGEEESTAKLIKDFGLTVIKDPKTGEFTHYDSLILVDRDGNVRKYIDGSHNETMSADQIMKYVKAVL
ncbi:SCO family protein [Paenibacillus sp. MMS18-CY102]|uniref:SCO family protein n=1 Tax=Paenibacillus sp. MMS18-CY102 TaxID=2682849 RepID=UPI0013654838|nr:SCO family protein [Paenibacillus sp. MMS18-CY102]MWC29534.1 redoxin domain-containing protein [Paenibacillus sp. MMS18-CY102]